MYRTGFANFQSVAILVLVPLAVGSIMALRRFKNGRRRLIFVAGFLLLQIPWFLAVHGVATCDVGGCADGIVVAAFWQLLAFGISVWLMEWLLDRP
jgi:hypothetical protein